jgi:hypothetical protein
MNIIRFAILLLVMMFSVWILFPIRNVSYAFQNWSDHFFVVSMILGLPAFVGITESFKVFHGFQFVMRTLFSPQFKMQYPEYHDYKASKSTKKETSIFVEILVIAVVFFVASLVFANMSMPIK